MSFDVCVYDTAHRIAHRIAHSVTPVQATIWRLRPQELSNLSKSQCNSGFWTEREGKQEGHREGQKVYLDRESQVDYIFRI